MTIYYSDLSTAAPEVLQLYPPRSVCCADADYDIQLEEKALADQLEDLLALYHYHQTALLELVRSDAAADSGDWEYGAHLLGVKLQQQSKNLLKQLPAPDDHR